MTKNIKKENIDNTIQNLARQEETLNEISLPERFILDESNQSTNTKSYVIQFGKTDYNIASTFNNETDNFQDGYINDFLFSTLLKTESYNDQTMYDVLNSRTNLYLNENDLLFLIRETLLFGTNKSFMFFLNYQKTLPYAAVDILSNILDNKKENNDDNILNHNRFSMILSKINKKDFYVENSYKLFMSIIFSEQLWPIHLLENKLNFKNIPNLVDVIYEAVDNFKLTDLNQDVNKEHNLFVKALLSILINNTKLSKADAENLCRIGLDLVIKDIPYLFDILMEKGIYIKYFFIPDKISEFYQICAKNYASTGFKHLIAINSDYFKYIDNEGNNIFYHSIISNDIFFAAHLLDHDVLDYDTFVSMFFSKNLYGSSAFDIIKIQKDPTPMILYILNKIIDSKSEFSQLFKTLPHKINYGNLGMILKSSNLILFKKIENRSKILLSEKYHILYNNQSIETLENKIKLLSAVDSIEFSNLIKKIKEDSGTRILINNEKLKQNIDSLRSKFPNFSNFIDFVENNIYLNELTDDSFSIPPSLLVGSPGIGKTFFMHSLAKAIGNSYELISMESVSAGFVLIGNSSQWSGGKYGLIFDKAFNSKYANNILLLDELDKTRNDSNYPVGNVLLPLLEGHTSSQFKDEYIGMPIDISKMVWIATANDKNSISPPLLNRFNVFDIPDPTLAERKILTKEIFSTIIDNLKINDKFSADISDDVLNFICSNESSGRDLRKILTRAISNSAKRKDTKILIDDINLDGVFRNKIGFI